MRPVNLVPPEERTRAGGAGEGLLAYGVVAVLAVVLIAVVTLVMTDNQVSDKQAELSALQAREDAARAQAEALAPYAQFASLSQARDATVASLAKSRFDWERVLRELALVIPDDVWLTSTTGTVSPSVTVEGSTGNPLRAQAPGPALELVGCGDGQEAVAGFVAALKDIDGVTRVGLNSSELPSGQAAGSSGDSGGGEGGDCRTRNFIARFEIVVAFDAVPPPVEAGVVTPGAAPAATAPEVGAGETSTATEAVPGAAETAAAEQQESDSVKKQTDRAQQARDIIPGSGG